MGWSEIGGFRVEIEMRTGERTIMIALFKDNYEYIVYLWTQQFNGIVLQVRFFGVSSAYSW